MKKFMVTLLVAAMGLTMLAGCGDQAADDASNGSAGSETSANEETNDADAEATAGDINYVDLSGQDLYVGVATGSSGTAWRDQMFTDMETALQEYVDSGDIAGYTIVNNTTNGDANEQAEVIRNFIDDSQINIIMVNPNDSISLNEAIEDAEAAGKLVVCFDATVEAEGVLNVSVDHYSYAYDPTITLCDLLGGSGTIVEISGLDGHPANVVRVDATDEALANYPDITLSQNTPGGWDQTTSKSIMASILAAGVAPDGIISQDSECYGILQACLDANTLPKVMSGDSTKPFFEAWKEIVDSGTDFDAVVVPNPPGISVTATRIAVRMAQGKQLDPSVLDGSTYYYKVNSLYTNENFDDGWEIVKDFNDEQCMDEWLSDAEADALFTE